MGNKTTGRNWTRRSIEEIFDDMFAKKGGSPGPSGQGDIFALLTVDSDFLSGIGAQYFLGYNTFTPGSGTIRDLSAYKRSGTNGIDVMRWPDSYSASDIENMMWKRRLPNNAMILFIPPSGTDLYLATYYGQEIFNLQMNNVTATYTLSGVDYTYACQKFSRGTAVNLDDALQACSGYGSGGQVLLVRGYSPGEMQSLALDDTNLLSIANTILLYYQTAQKVNNVIRV